MVFDNIRFALFCIKHHHKIIHGVIKKGTSFIVEKGAVLSLGDRFGISSFSKITVRKGARLTIGKDFSSNNNLFVACREAITIGNNANIGPNVVIVDNNHDYTSVDFKSKFVTRSITIGDNVWLGASVVVLPGTIIGDNVTIGAGTVVHGTIPPNTIVYNSGNLVFKQCLRK